MTYAEAPMLAAMVADGSLPPVEERLPTQPMVIDLPWSAVGTYGGTMRKVTTASDFSDQTQFMYGASPLHWIDGGQNAGPGMVYDWDSNEDRTEWTLYFREGTKWSDGAPFTVDDVSFWWEDIVLNPEHPDVPPAWTLSGGTPMQLEKIDDYTLKLIFADSMPIADLEIAAWAGGGMGTGLDSRPKHYLEQFHPDYSDAENFEAFLEREDWWTNPETPVLTAWMPVQLEPGSRLVLERNPYYYMVDKEGNQLPYIDRVEVNLAADLEVVNLQITNGEVDFLANPNLRLSDVPLYADNQERGNYHLELWDNGAGGAPAWGINWNHPDPEKRELFRTIEFRRALSYSMDRERMRQVSFLGLGGPASTAVDSINSRQYHNSERGEELLDQLLNLAVEYDPELAAEMLDDINVVDQDGDGWRDLPSGAPLEIRLQLSTGHPFTDSTILMAEDWQNIGLNAIVDPLPGEQIGIIFLRAEFDLLNFYGGAPGQADLLSFPVFLISYGSGGRFAPLYGSWMELQGTANEGVDVDLPPRERSPMWEEPEEGDPVRRMWDLYDEARSEPDLPRRDELIYEILQIHVDEGPFWLGVIADLPRPIIVSNRLQNVPTRDNLPLGGWMGPYVLSMPGAITYPEQYFISE